MIEKIKLLINLAVGYTYSLNEILEELYSLSTTIISGNYSYKIYNKIRNSNITAKKVATKWTNLGVSRVAG